MMTTRDWHHKWIIQFDNPRHEYLSVRHVMSCLDGNFTAVELRQIANLMDGMANDPNRPEEVWSGVDDT